jgi:hypothetical protein
MDEVPGTEPSLLALDQKQTLTRQHKEVLLCILCVVQRIRLARTEDANAEADLIEACVLGLEGGVQAATVRLEPRDTARVDDKPTLSGRTYAALDPLEGSLGNHRPSLIVRDAQTVPEAIKWQRHHDWDAVRGRCHELARRARNELGPDPIAPDSPDFYGQMISLRLPAAAPDDLQERVYDEHRIEIPTFERDGGRLIRASFQGYNDAGDLERPRAALAVLL